MGSQSADEASSVSALRRKKTRSPHQRKQEVKSSEDRSEEQCEDPEAVTSVEECEEQEALVEEEQEEESCREDKSVRKKEKRRKKKKKKKKKKKEQSSPVGKDSDDGNAHNEAVPEDARTKSEDKEPKASDDAAVAACRA